MCIPFITKYKALKEEVKTLKKDLDLQKEINADLREEHREDKLKIDKCYEFILRVKNHVNQHYSDCMYLEDQITNEIKELDVSETY